MKNSFLTHITLLCAILAGSGSAVRAGLVINEIVCGTSGDDWVEIMLTPDSPGPQDISGLLVTMYYGSNEKLSERPVTLHPAASPDPPGDDRFAVGWLTKAAGMTKPTKTATLTAMVSAISIATITAQVCGIPTV